MENNRGHASSVEEMRGPEPSSGSEEGRLGNGLLKMDLKISTEHFPPTSDNSISTPVPPSKASLCSQVIISKQISSHLPCLPAL